MHMHAEIRLFVMGAVSCLHRESISELWHSNDSRFLPVLTSSAQGESEGELLARCSSKVACDPSASELPLPSAPSSCGPAPLHFWHQNCSCQILFHILLASFTFSFRADLVHKYDLSTIGAGLGCFDLLLPVFTHL